MSIKRHNISSNPIVLNVNNRSNITFELFPWREFIDAIFAHQTLSKIIKPDNQFRRVARQAANLSRCISESEFRMLSDNSITNLQ